MYVCQAESATIIMASCYNTRTVAVQRLQSTVITTITTMSLQIPENTVSGDSTPNLTDSDDGDLSDDTTTHELLAKNIPEYLPPFCSHVCS